MWIELHTTLIHHPKIEKLCIELGIKRHEAIGYVCSLWLWAMLYAEDGDLSKISPEIIENACGWQGDKLKLFEKLLGIFVDDDMKLHDWLDYAGTYLTKKYHTTNRDKLAKIWKKYGYVYGRGKYSKSSGSKEAVKRQSRGSKEAVKRQITIPNHTIPNHTTNKVKDVVAAGAATEPDKQPEPQQQINNPEPQTPVNEPKTEPVADKHDTGPDRSAQPKPEPAEAEINGYGKLLQLKGPKFIETFKNFVEMRKKIRSPMTDRAKELILMNLDKLSKNADAQIAILEQSIMNSWKGVFRLKEKFTGTGTSGKYDYLEEADNEFDK